MALVTIEGVYENGKVELAEAPKGIERAKVMVTFLPETETGRAEHGGKSRATDLRNAAPPATNDRYPQTLRDEYKSLIQKKLHGSLTREDAGRLDAVRSEINRLDRQTETWSAREHHAREVDQALAAVRGELEALADA